MARRAHRKYTIAEVLAECPDDVCDLTLELREFVRSVVPEARETVRWEGLFYTRPGEDGFVKADVCRIAPREDGVHLGFVHGALLPDPDGLLKGDRKYMRYVKLHTAGDIRCGPLRKLLRASFKFRPGPGDAAV